MRTSAFLAAALTLTAAPAVAADAPDTEITAAPVGTITESTATFTFTSSATQFECSVDGAAFSACTSPFTVNDVGDGLHTFAVRALDESGTVDPTPATANWSVMIPEVKPITIPARVGDIQVERERTSAVITWRPVYGATAYLLRIGKKTKTVHRTHYRLEHLRPGRKYRITIVATNRFGSSPMAPLRVRKYKKH